MKRRIAAAMLILLLPLGAAACGGSKSNTPSASSSGEPTASAAPTQDAPSDQTVLDACAKIAADGKSVADELNSMKTEAATNPQKAAEALKSLSTKLQETSSSINNAEVKDKLDAAATDLGAAAQSLEDALTNPSPATVADAQSAFQQASTSLGELKELCSFE